MRQSNKKRRRKKERIKERKERKKKKRKERKVSIKIDHVLRNFFPVPMKRERYLLMSIVELL